MSTIFNCSSNGPSTHVAAVRTSIVLLSTTRIATIYNRQDTVRSDVRYRSVLENGTALETARVCLLFLSTKSNSGGIHAHATMCTICKWRKYFSKKQRKSHNTAFYGSRKLRKMKVCKLISQLSSCTLFMGAKSCAKSLETFTFDNNRAIWSKSLQTFCVANVAEESCTAEIIPVRGQAKNMNCSRGSHHPYTITRASPTRRTPHRTWTWITR